MLEEFIRILLAGVISTSPTPKIQEKDIQDGLHDVIKENVQYSNRLSNVIKDSRSNNTPTCGRANLELVDYKEQPAAIDALIQNLQNKYWQDPASAAEALGMTRDPRAFDALVKALDYHSVSYSLSPGDIKVVRRGPNGSIQDLVKYEGGHVSCPSLRWGIAHGFGGLGDERAIPYLRRLLFDKEPDACRAAADVLVQYGDKDAIPSMKKGIHEYTRKLIKYAKAEMESKEKEIKEQQSQIEKALKEDPSRLYTHTRSLESFLDRDKKEYQAIRNALFDNDGNERNPEEATKLLMDNSFSKPFWPFGGPFNDYPEGYIITIRKFQNSVQELENIEKFTDKVTFDGFLRTNKSILDTSGQDYDCSKTAKIYLEGETIYLTIGNDTRPIYEGVVKLLKDSKAATKPPTYSRRPELYRTGAASYFDKPLEILAMGTEINKELEWLKKPGWLILQLWDPERKAGFLYRKLWDVKAD